MHRAGFPSPGTSALRRGRRSEPGRCYLLTFTCKARAPLFSDATIARAAARTLTERRLWRDSHLLCWVLMPDHWHGLIELSAAESLSTLATRIKAISARTVAVAAERSGPVWASGFHDRALRKDDDLLTAARYIIRNPVRAGFCARVGDYPYWDAVWL
ncbi:REP-associated tyrosine transposase [Dokdonella fugitiva]|uniref:REP-associated tyrosine transposase n=1 Tax=Dokdonella fugitiva TaxID=328517 RepID=UPI0015F818BF